jgi:hypothetical protein
MAKTLYNLLSINDYSSRQTRMVSRESSDDSYPINVDEGHAQLRGEMSSLISNHIRFRNCVFTTHGSPGMIWFGDQWLSTEVWYGQFYGRGYDRLFPFPNTHLYFAGCNVAEGQEGWKFLEAAARSLLQTAGGSAVGWTSLGFGSFFSGHVRHFWGDTRQVMVLPGGGSLRFYENWNLITDGTNPARP